MAENRFDACLDDKAPAAARNHVATIGTDPDPPALPAVSRPLEIMDLALSRWIAWIAFWLFQAFHSPLFIASIAPPFAPGRRSSVLPSSIHCRNGMLSCWPLSRRAQATQTSSGSIRLFLFHPTPPPLTLLDSSLPTTNATP